MYLTSSILIQLVGRRLSVLIINQSYYQPRFHTRTGLLTKRFDWITTIWRRHHSSRTNWYWTAWSQNGDKALLNHKIYRHDKFCAEKLWSSWQLTFPYFSLLQQNLPRTSTIVYMNWLTELIHLRLTYVVVPSKENSFLHAFCTKMPLFVSFRTLLLCLFVSSTNDNTEIESNDRTRPLRTSPRNGTLLYARYFPAPGTVQRKPNSQLKSCFVFAVT